MSPFSANRNASESSLLSLSCFTQQDQEDQHRRPSYKDGARIKREIESAISEYRDERRTAPPANLLAGQSANDIYRLRNELWALVGYPREKGGKVYGKGARKWKWLRGRKARREMMDDDVVMIFERAVREAEAAGEVRED